jgi:hypothetical protein
MKNLTIGFALIIVVLNSCTKENNGNKENITYNINGKVQKGPFLIGTELTVIELDNNLHPTGKNYFTTITDDLGSFRVPDVKLASDYVILKAHGAYFNELDSTINTNLVLNCLANVSRTESININIITHLTKERIINLVSKGKCFADARKITNNEFLKIFELNNYTLEYTDKLDMIKSSESNDILFALNMVIIGNLSGVRLTEFLTKFIFDFETDGKIDNKDIQSQLISNALYAAPIQSWSTLKARYNQLGINTKENYSSKYIKEFINKTSYKGYFDSETPKSTANGLNLITLSDGEKLDSSINYTIALTKSDTTNGNFYLSLSTLSSESEVVFNNPKWHSDKGERDIWCFDNIDNAIKLKGSGKIKLHYCIRSDKYSTINVIKYFTW